MRSRSFVRATLSRTNSQKHQQTITDFLTPAFCQDVLALSWPSMRVEQRLLKRCTPPLNFLFSWGKGWKTLTTTWQRLVTSRSAGMPSMWVLWWWEPSRMENSKIKQTFSYFVAFEADWGNVLFGRSKESNILVCVRSQAQNLALCKALGLPLETSLTPTWAAWAMVPSDAKGEDLGCDTRIRS